MVAPLHWGDVVLVGFYVCSFSVPLIISKISFITRSAGLSSLGKEMCVCAKHCDSYRR